MNRLRSLAAYALARRWCYFSMRSEDQSPTCAVLCKVDDLKRRGLITGSKYDRLVRALDGLRQSDMDRDERIDDLVDELALNLFAWRDEFSTTELDRLARTP